MALSKESSVCLPTVIQMFFAIEQKAIDEAETVILGKKAELDLLLEMDEELSEHEVPPDIEIDLLRKEIRQKTKIVMELKSALDKRTREQYPRLTNNECLELLFERKWYKSIVNGIYALYEAVNHHIADHVAELTERYELTLPALETEVTELGSKVKSHLKGMGFVW
jgi:type I restriction enzyme M protein